MSTLQQVAPKAFRAAVSQALDAGERFGGGWVSAREGASMWRVLLVAPPGTRVISCEAPDGRVDSIIELAEAAAWDEREAHDLYGLDFVGHSPLRALATHTEDPDRWMTPVSGHGVHQVAVGPIHAGVIESGHFRFHVVGERILAMDPRLFYKHRGLERAAQGHDAKGALRYAHRACAACVVANTTAYAQAVEDARGLSADRDLRVARTVLLELERLYNHLHDIGAICAGVGYAPGTMAFAALKDRAQQINANAFAHRLLFDTVAVAHGAVELDRSATADARAALRELHTDTAAAWRELEFAGSLQTRLDGVGILDEHDARRLGTVGPAARAAGIVGDLRQSDTRLAYDGFTAASLDAATGDVAARLRLRAAELESTHELLEELLARPLARGATLADGSTPEELGVGRVESPRGATTCTVELHGERVARLHLRTASYANWPSVAHAATGNLLPDFPLINKSFELCYACVDR
ncbi:MAG TPA: NADH-quinone oxidoreductase subunit C [Solirubrobacteraceae bacterium]